MSQYLTSLLATNQLDKLHISISFHFILSIRIIYLLCLCVNIISNLLLLLLLLLHIYDFCLLCIVFTPQLVIANVLQTRKNRVVFVTPSNSYEVHLTREQTLQGLEIEELIVADVVSMNLI